MGGGVDGDGLGKGSNATINHSGVVFLFYSLPIFFFIKNVN